MYWKDACSLGHRRLSWQPLGLNQAGSHAEEQEDLPIPPRYKGSSPFCPSPPTCETSPRCPRPCPWTRVFVSLSMHWPQKWMNFFFCRWAARVNETLVLWRKRVCDVTQLGGFGPWVPHPATSEDGQESKCRYYVRNVRTADFRHVDCIVWWKWKV